MSTDAASVSALRLRSKYPMDGSALKRAEAKTLEDQGHVQWLGVVFPDQFDAPFIKEHADFWDWGWKFLVCLRDRKPLPPEANAFLDLLSRNLGKSMHCEVFMAAAVCVVGYGIFLYVCGSQDLANEHLENIEGLLTSDGVKQYYPEHSRPKKSAITGANRAWSQKKLATEGGAIIWAIGLNVGVRGIRRGKDRVRGFVLDDVDDYNDSPQVSLNKANQLGSSILPTSDIDFFVIGAQNLITEHSVFNRIYTKADMMLAHRVVAGPVPAFDNLVTRFIDGRDMIISGDSRWPERLTVEVGQRFIDTFGLIRFLAEFQHDFASNKQGLCLDNYDDAVHVITKSEFNSVFGVREIPRRWWKYQFHDHARTKTAYHANVTGTVAVSSMNEKLPGFIFLFNLMSFPAQTEADDLAIRLLKGISSSAVIHGQQRAWDELVESSMKRTNLEAFQSDVTKLIRMRRATLSKVIPPIVQPMIVAHNYKAFRMSHEQINAAGTVYREAFGLPFEPCNPGSDGGIELFNHYLKVDYSAQHPFGPNVNRPNGLGFTRVFIVIDDGDLEYTDDVAPERLHDAMLARYQFRHWRYATPTLNANGEKEFGPQKMNDDFGNGCFVAGTCIQTEMGERPIEQVMVGDMVWTRCGLRTVLAAGYTGDKATHVVKLSNGQLLTGTGDHPVWVNNGWKSLVALKENDKILSWGNSFLGLEMPLKDQGSERSLSSMVFGFTDIRAVASSRIVNTSSRIYTHAYEVSKRFTLRFGRLLTARFSKAWKFITQTAIIPTTIPITSWLPLAASTHPYMPSSGRTRRSDSPISSAFNRSVERGIQRLKVGNGTASIRWLLSIGLMKRVVSFAGTSLRLGAKIADSAHSNAHGVSGITLNDSVSVVKGPIPFGVRATYNLQVEGEPEYFANGVLVHNCMMLFHDNLPQAAPLNKDETIHEYLPPQLRDIDTDEQLRRENPQKWAKLKTAQIIKSNVIAKQVNRPKTRNALSRYRAFSGRE